MPRSVLWFRRDLRLSDHPALLAAVGEAGADGVVPLFVLDPALWRPAGPPRRAWLVRSLRALDQSLGGTLVVHSGDPIDVVPRVAAGVGASGVHVTADAGPYGRRRDGAVAGALAAAGRRLVATGTPYAVGPGTVLNGSGGPYRVFTPFSRAWAGQGWPAPATPTAQIVWAGTAASGIGGQRFPDEPDLGDLRLPEAGEAAALRRWRAFLENGLPDYADRRDRPDLDATSGMSAHLKYGEIHPRTLLADLAGRSGRGPDVLRSELAWREFYADVLWHHPTSARDDLRPEFSRMRYDDPATVTTGQRLAAWQQGRTGFPLVDAGMRQLLAGGWMHNRVRMVAASFLVKDLHIQWQHGARWFMRWLRDGDLASNNHGWQWAAGSGTDAAPYFRVFNPVTQGERFDPDGTFVRRYVPELAHLQAGTVHQPWLAADGYAHGYPARIVDHVGERTQALARYQEIKDR